MQQITTAAPAAIPYDSTKAPMTDAETIAALRAENVQLAAALEHAEAPPTSGTFKPFSWLHHGAQRLPGAETICQARDVAHGAALVLELVNDSTYVAEGSDEAPYLDHRQRDDLLRLVEATMKLLAYEAARECDRLNALASAQRG